MAIGLGSNFELRAKLPLDSRSLFDTVADLKAYPENFLADSCDALVKDEPNTLFIFNRNNADDAELGKWRRLKGSDLTDYLKKVDADALLDNKVDKEDGKGLLDNTDKDKYDDAVTKAHEHTNESVLDDLSDSNGILLYKGSIIGSNSGSGTTTGYTKTEADALLATKVDKVDGKSLLADTDKADYDDAVTKAHEHTNYATLDKLEEDADGELIYDGKKISVDLSVYSKTETDTLLADKVDKEDDKGLLSDNDKANYDDAVAKAHEHTNSTVLDKLTDNAGELEYDGKKISTDLSTVYSKTETDTLLADKVDKEDGKALLADTDKANYDEAVTKAHEHSNETVLDKLEENDDGELEYNGKKISADLSTVYSKTETDALLADKLNKEDGKALLDDTDKALYDEAVTKAHEHSNETILDKLTDNDGELEYNGKKISTDLSTVYTKTEADALLATKVDKEDGKGLLADTDKANYDDAVTKAHEHTNSSVLDKLSEDAEGNPLYNGEKISADLSTVYSKTEADALLDTKVDKEEGYSLLADTDKTVYDDAVSKAHEHSNKEVINKLTDNSGELEYNGKKISADLSTVYTKTEADTLLDDKVNKEDGKSLLSDTDKELYDDAVSKAHKHTNSTVLDKLSEDDNGNPTYNGNAIGGSGASSADKVSYDNTGYPAYTDVSLALNALFDKVFYDKPVITSFVMTPADTLYEIGSTVNSITFNWTTNKNITGQTLTDCTLADETVRTATYSTPLSTNKTFILSITDGQETVTAKKDIKFGWKVYYGSALYQTTYDDAFLLGLSDSMIKENKSGNYTVDVANNEYFYIAMPESYNNSNEIVGKIGGFETSFDKVSSFAHTNASGGSTTYNVYRSTNHSLGSITFVI